MLLPSIFPKIYPIVLFARNSKKGPEESSLGVLCPGPNQHIIGK